MSGETKSINRSNQFSGADGHALAVRRPLMLNLGCGSIRHPDWLNVDFSPWEQLKNAWWARPFLRGRPDPSYLNHDLRSGIPFADETVDAVYAAHVLEHIRREDVSQFLKEIHRVLKPGAWVRIVVPDLEEIVRYYLSALDGVRAGRADARTRHQWAVLWMFDQMVREIPGGEMTSWIIQNGRSPVLDELGGEVQAWARDLRESHSPTVRTQGKAPRLKLRDRIPRAIEQWIAPRSARDTGELHQWMYDEVSLAGVLTEAGFIDCGRRTFDESRIADWKAYRFDHLPDGSERQPGSLWMEARRG